MKANIRDRASIKTAYPGEAFASDARANDDPKTSVHRGIRILTPLDEEGSFALERAARHVGEATGTPDEAPFLAPFLTVANVVSATVDPGKRPRDAASDAAHGSGEYDAFIDRIIATAVTARFRPQPAPDDERLRGPRQ